MIKHLAFLTTLFLSLNFRAQSKDFVKSDAVNLAVHQANIGKIAFTGENIPIENLNQADFLESFELKENSDLNIRVFLKTSLTNELHLLAPKLTSPELTNNGNYQFTFFVDAQKIYVENLNIGAGTSESKDQRLTFRVPLLSSANEDSWGRFLWNRFLANGGEDAFSTGEHLLKIEVTPYLKQTGILTGKIIAEGNLKIIVPEIVIDENLVKVPDIEPLKDWEISKENIDLFKIEELNRKILTKKYKDVTSVIVIKNDQLLLEEYFNGATRDTLHDTRSVGKSFASTLLGIAIEDGFIKNENETLKEFYDLKKFKNYSPAKEIINLKDLLTMRSAFEGSDIDSDSPGNEENMYPTENWVHFTLDLPIDKTKVTEKRWDYFTAGVVLMGDIIHKSVPDGLEKYADKKLFQLLGITSYKWQLTPQNVANTAGSLQLRSLDLAKFGQLYKNQGLWKGRQILSRDWVAKSLSPQIEISEGEFYGYLFWNKTYKVNGKAYEVYYSSGNGGNRIFIFKDQPVVIVITATAYNTPNGEKQVEKMMENELIPAIFQ